MHANQKTEPSARSQGYFPLPQVKGNSLGTRLINIYLKILFQNLPNQNITQCYTAVK